MKFSIKFFLIFSFSYLISFSISDPIIRGSRTLIILEAEIQKFSFSILFDELIKNKFSLTYKFADDSSLTLTQYGEYIYENLILLAPSTEEFGGEMNLHTIIEFVDSGRNLFIGINSQVTNLIRDIAIKCGMDVDEPGSIVRDHFHYSQNRIYFPISNIFNSPLFIGDSSLFKDNAFIFYDGIGFRMNHSNPLVFSILKGSFTSYSSHTSLPLNFFPHALGRETVLIGGLQTRNNGRIIISGSIDFFNDRYLSFSAFNKHITPFLFQWCFKNKGIIRIVSVHHFRSNDKLTPNTYTVNDDVSFSIRIEELKYDSWTYFENKDIQIEFRRIDPFIRLTLNNSMDRSHIAQFKLPDVYGVFQFIVKYSRIGYNFINSVTQVSVRPFEHKEYERFIFCAFPYYFSSFSMILGFIIFGIIFLNHNISHKSKFD